MPIRPEHRWLYPIDWPELSRMVRFRRAKGRCEHCARPHGRDVVHLGDGTWWDEEVVVWRDGRGRRLRYLPSPDEFTPRQRVLGGIAPQHVTPEIMARCIAPPVERLHRRVLAARQAPEVVRIGRAVERTEVSLVIPIYRNVFYLRHQLAAFARDNARGFDEAMLFAFEDEVDPGAADLRRAHHIKKCVENIARGNDADQASICYHR